jgi:DNA-binding CsgD family transcriptional regulator/tetratricopeptide (TPR) repeat protein
MMVGRTAERARLDLLLAAAVAGRSAALVIRGEPGIGKTALLQYAAARADGWRIVQTGGVESEMELPFAALHQLCASLLQDRNPLPTPQLEALTVAFGLDSGPPPDRFLVGLAVLTLLSQAADQAPLLCLVDDAQWLDQSSLQVLAFVARRLQAEAVVLLFTERSSAASGLLDRLAEMRLEGLDNEAALQLFHRAVSGPVDSRVRARIMAETRGNPLALLELPLTTSTVELAGGFPLPSVVPVQGRIETSYRARVQRLPVATQRLLLVAASEPTGDPALLWAAAAELKVVPDDVAPAEADHLVEVGAQLTFRHPLLRSAIYQAATPAERRRVHGALAAVTDRSLDPDRRAWHLAQATLAPDEAVAAELERSAGRALVRGGLAAASAFLERAASLTPDPGRRARRELEAARTRQLSGFPEAALALLGRAAAGPLQELDGALLQRLHGEIALDLRRGGEAVPLLLEAARRLEPLDPALARETYLEALRAASIGGRLGAGVRTAAEAARRARPAVGTPRGLDLLLDGLALRFTEGYAASAATLQHALVALVEEGSRPGQDVRWPWLARRVAPDLFEDQTWEALATRNVEIAREAGALAVLPLALHSLATKRIFDGELEVAEAMLAEADVIVEATGTSALVLTRLLLVGWRGDEAGATVLLNESQAAIRERGEGVVLSFAEYARAILYNGLGQYEAAAAAASSAVECDELMTSVWSLPELVEAATRCGQVELATAALGQLIVCTRAAGTEVGLGLEARSRALLSQGDAAERLYQEALRRLGETGNRSALARAHLVYGEWLRREGRRKDAREQLRTAHERLITMGAVAFADRAHRELLATGERVRKRTDDTRDSLTAQESQIAGLAAAGRTNLEIGAELFLSSRTVEWHLRKVFTKLDITSRRQLRGGSRI